MVMLEYTGQGSGKQSFRVPHTGHIYQVSARASHRYVPVPPEDVDYLISLSFFRRQIAPAPFVPPPIIDEVPEVVEPAQGVMQKRTEGWEVGMSKEEKAQAKAKRDKVPA
jgi:hypothetical protein